MDTIRQDLRYGLKLLIRDRGFLAASLLTLAVCIGANTAVFSVIHSVVLKPLPFAQPDRLVTIYNSYPNAGAPRGGAGVPDYYDRLEGTTAFAELALYTSRGITIGESGATERVQALAVTPSFFRALGIPAAAGRTFVEEEAEPGNDRRVVLSHALWRDAFGASDAIGRELRVNGEPYTVVGVMPRGFGFADPQVVLWLPLAFTAAERGDDRRHNNNWEMLGLLRPGVPIEQAQAEIYAVDRRNDERFPQFAEVLRNAGYRTVVVDYKNDLIRDVRGTLALLQAGVVLVLLIGCVNIANLMLVRSTARTRELATRAALGADPRRLTRQLLTESVLLGVIGGAVGLLVAAISLRLFDTLGAGQLPRGADIGLNGQVMLATAGISILAGLLFGTIPVIRMRRGELSSVFREEGRGGTSSRAALALRGGLVVVQITLAFALLIGGGLLGVSFARLLSVDPGFDPDGVVTAAVSLPVTKYADESARRRFFDEALTRIRAMPGVEHAGATDNLPFGGNTSSSVMSPENYRMSPGESPISPAYALPSPGYMEAMGIRLVRGRFFEESDGPDAPLVAIIDEWLANRFWPGRDPIGQRMFQGVRGAGFDDQIVLRTIVGVVGETRVHALSGRQFPGHYYFPARQETRATAFFTIRTAAEPQTIVGALRAAVAEIDPDLPVYDVRTMEERISSSLTTERARMVLLGAFSLIALFLAAIGIYGVLAYTVALRRAEFGIRLALGGSAASVFRIVLAQGARLIAVGLAIGVAASLVLTRLVRSMLFDVTPHDPLVFAGVAAALAAVAAIACLIPARRATRVDPADALREGNV